MKISKPPVAPVALLGALALAGCSPGTGTEAAPATVTVTQTVTCVTPEPGHPVECLRYEHDVPMPRTGYGSAIPAIPTGQARPGSLPPVDGGSGRTPEPAVPVAPAP